MKNTSNTTYFFNHFISPPIWATLSLNGFLLDFVSLIDLFQFIQNKSLLLIVYIKKLLNIRKTTDKFFYQEKKTR